MTSEWCYCFVLFTVIKFLWHHTVVTSSFLEHYLLKVSIFISPVTCYESLTHLNVYQCCICISLAVIGSLWLNVIGC